MTLVSHTQRFVFLKTYKTASTSVEAYLEGYCLPPDAQSGTKVRKTEISEYGIVGSRGEAVHCSDSVWRGHMPAAQVRSALGAKLFESYTKVITIRNPFPRLVSAFQVKSLDRGVALDLPAEAQIAQFRSWLQTNSDALDDLLCYTIDGAPVVDFAVRIEHLEDDLAELTRTLALPRGEHAALAHFRRARNRKAARVPYETFYDEDARAFVTDHFAWELARFGYAFGQPDPHFPSPEAAAQSHERAAKRAARRAKRAALAEQSHEGQP